jgi:hypothetical protein
MCSRLDRLRRFPGADVAHRAPHACLRCVPRRNRHPCVGKRLEPRLLACTARRECASLRLSGRIDSKRLAHSAGIACPKPRPRLLELRVSASASSIGKLGRRAAALAVRRADLGAPSASIGRLSGCGTHSSSVAARSFRSVVSRECAPRAVLERTFDSEMRLGIGSRRVSASKQPRDCRAKDAARVCAAIPARRLRFNRPGRSCLTQMHVRLFLNPHPPPLARSRRRQPTVGVPGQPPAAIATRAQ